MREIYSTLDSTSTNLCQLLYNHTYKLEQRQPYAYIQSEFLVNLSWEKQ